MPQSLGSSPLRHTFFFRTHFTSSATLGTLLDKSCSLELELNIFGNSELSACRWPGAVLGLETRGEQDQRGSQPTLLTARGWAPLKSLHTHNYSLGTWRDKRPS